MLNNYRTTQNKNEILRLFSNDDSQESFVWQNIKGRRFIHNIESVTINSVLQMINITFEKNFEFIHPNSFFYVKLANNESVCKARYLSHSEKELALYYPDRIKTLELRTEKRYSFKKSQNITASVVVSSDVVSRATQALHLKIIDISLSGISFYVDTKKIDKILGSETYIMTHINEKALEKPIVMDHIYAQPFTFRQVGRTKNAYKVGFKLSTPLSQFFLDTFLLVI